MVQGKGEALVVRQTGEIIEAEALAVSPAYVQETTKSIALLQDMTRNLLKRDRDYGRTPGTASDGLWDPGASLIIGAFNCYIGQRRLVSLVDEEDKISLIVEVPIISRHSGKEIGSGVGAASTLETKYKYRWLYPSELKELGYTDEQIRSLKRDKKHPGKYRVDNLERGELLNTLVKQASKRAEVDAAEALPGVASVLREIFGQKQDEYQGPVWQRFWGECTRLGYAEKEVHAKFNVKSMKEWLDSGRTLDEALDILRGRTKTGENVATQDLNGAPPEDLQVEPPAATETPADNRSMLWANIKSLLARVKPRPTEDSVVKWFAGHHQLTVSLATFDLPEPPAEVTEKILTAFHDTLLTFEESKKKAKPA